MHSGAVSASTHLRFSSLTPSANVLKQLFLVVLLQVSDDEGMLASCSITQAYIPAACRRFRSNTFPHGKPGKKLTALEELLQSEVYIHLFINVIIIGFY